MSALKENTVSLCLSSSTYLNASEARILLPATKMGKVERGKELFRQVPLEAIKAELDSVIDQMSYADLETYIYLKGQYTVLFRLCFLEASEAMAQAKASSPYSQPGGYFTKPIRFQEGPGPLADAEYLERCGIPVLPDGWQVKYQGKVKSGNQVWCWGCEQWEVADRENVGTRVTQRFTIEEMGEGEQK